MLLALAMAFGAAFSVHLGGIRVRASDPARPLLIAAVMAWSGVLASRPGAARQLGISLGTVACSYIVALGVVRANAQDYAIGDAAFLELYTLHVTRGVWSLGPYSQLGWHHPGPLYFYFLAPLYAAGGFRFAAINVGAALINVASVTALFIIVARSGSRSLALCVSTVLGLYMIRLSPLFVSAWNPHVLVLPMAVFVVVSAALASGQLSLTPLAIVVGSFCVQTHVGLALPVVSLWAFTFVIITLFTYLGGIAKDTARRWLNVAMWTSAVCWLLPLAEELENSPGNMTTIFKFFYGSQQRQSLNAISIDLVNHAFRRAIIRCGSDAWGEHAGVVLELYKRRVPVAVDRESLFMFGRPLALNGEERVEYFVYRTSSYSAESDRPGTEVVLRQADVTVTRRACTGPDVSRPCLLIE